MSQSLDRGLEILKSLLSAPKTVDEIAADLDVHATTAFRLLKVLEEHRFVKKMENRQFCLGPAFLGLSSTFMGNNILIEVARPFMVRLNYRTMQAVHLAVFDAGEAMYIDKLEAKHGFRTHSRIGLSAPMHASAIAKVILAYLKKRERDALVESINYERFTPATIHTREAMRADINRTRENGYATEVGEQEPYMNAIALPILDPAGRLLAGLSVSAPAPVMPFSDLLELLDDVTLTCKDIASELLSRDQP
ncbi:MULTISPECIES: IclR family transcriptional regulator [unclassified Caballeronia]|uniref:IclR family transcriptional regulator n=1 Tax=unclassified Caballeronia TaxID=2646786 RepID=UPI00285B0402|nr:MULTISPECIES: IclR family transcriptional regulator [unclassified Caballeronia]MDR5780973.1 IclR family transcriptional regulator [Caballeronia sp. LZ065]MDR5822333.1 IclR family transcriptional regulator [Caballeronia sp. LZ043]